MLGMLSGQSSSSWTEIVKSAARFRVSYFLLYRTLTLFDFIFIIAEDSLATLPSWTVTPFSGVTKLQIAITTYVCLLYGIAFETDAQRISGSECQLTDAERKLNKSHGLLEQTFCLLWLRSFFIFYFHRMVLELFDVSMNGFLARCYFNINESETQSWSLKCHSIKTECIECLPGQEILDIS